MSKNFEEVKQLLVLFLNELNIETKDFAELGEKLDSLDRLEVVTKFEEILRVDLTMILIEPKFWTSFSTLSEAISRHQNNVT